MENKTKEQLAEDKYPLINAFHLQNTAIKTGFYDGWEAQQPEIDELKSIISGKTFHNETEVLKAEIDALKEDVKHLLILLENKNALISTLENEKK